MQINLSTIPASSKWYQPNPKGCWIDTFLGNIWHPLEGPGIYLFKNLLFFVFFNQVIAQTNISFEIDSSLETLEICWWLGVLTICFLQVPALPLKQTCFFNVDFSMWDMVEPVSTPKLFWWWLKDLFFLCCFQLVLGGSVPPPLATPSLRLRWTIPIFRQEMGTKRWSWDDNPPKETMVGEQSQMLHVWNVCFLHLPLI